jgi:mRNA interferase MazF
MKRGDIVTVSAAGDYGKPRPAVVVQSDWLGGTDSVLVSLMTSTLRDAPLFRLTISPTPTNKLKATSQIMVDKVMAYPRRKCGKVIGQLDSSAVVALNHKLSVMLGLAD